MAAATLERSHSSLAVERTLPTNPARVTLGEAASTMITEMSREKPEVASDIHTHLKEHLAGRRMSLIESDNFSEFVVAAFKQSNIEVIEMRDIVALASSYVEQLARQDENADPVELARKFVDPVDARR